MPSLQTLVLLPALFSALPVFSAPSTHTPAKRDGTTHLTAAQVDAFKPYTYFAAAAYCSGTATCTCGIPCSGVSGFKPAITGGDGNDVQYYYVGYWATQNTIIVAHEGTDPTQFESLLTDIDIPMVAPKASLFPGVSSGVLIHQGFADEHALTAPTILAEVKTLLAAHKGASVTTVGHSLGGALAELDALFLTLNLPGTTIKSYTFGTPRVGNPAYVSWFDPKVPAFLRINNEYDIIPILPGRFLGFQHPHGETHLLSASDKNGYSCPGDDDAVDSECQIQSVPNIFEGDILNHLGPYNGVYIGTIYC